MWAALAQRRRPVGEVRRGFVGGGQRSETEGRADDVGIELAGPRNLAGHPALDLDPGEAEETSDHALDQRVPVFEDEQFIDVVDEFADLSCGDRVLADGQDGVVCRPRCSPADSSPRDRR